MSCQQPVFASPLQNEVYTAPIELIHDKPYVSVLVNGRGPYRFLIDTGTGTEALITPELAEELHLPAVGHARLSDPSRVGEQRSEIMRIETLKVAGAEFSEVDAVVHELNGEPSCEGVLGFTLFEDYLLTLDFPGRRMTLTDGEIDAKAGGSLLPFEMPDGVPIVTIRIGGQDFEGQIDSGGTGLSLPEKASRDLRFEAAPIEFAQGESVSTRFQIKAARLASDVKLGRYTFKQAFVEINAAFPMVNIGSTPLQRFVVTFDQGNQFVRLYSSEETLPLNASPSLMRLLNGPQPPEDGRLTPIGF
jgi:predicted aspartyl protease